LNSTQPRVGILLHDLRGGGAEGVMLKLARGLLDRGYAVDILLVRPGGVLMALIPDRAAVIELNRARVATAIPKLARYLRDHRPDWLISALTHVNLAAILARRVSGTGVRLMVTEHTQISRRARTAATLSARLTYALTPILYRLADRIVAVSDGAAEDLRAFARLPADRVQRIYNPVFDEGLLTASRADVDHPWMAGRHRVILAAGRLEPVKGFDILLRAFARLRQTEVCKLIILGEGQQRPALEALTGELGVAADVALPGFSASPYAFMSRADVFVVSSHFEGLSVALIEALACGAPVVSTDCPSGPSEILDGGEFGALVPVGDPEAMADAIRTTLAGPRGRHAHRAEAFSITESVEAYIDLMQASPRQAGALPGSTPARTVTNRK